MTISPDLKKGVTLGLPDGIPTFVESLGEVVDTYLDKRKDLATFSNGQQSIPTLMHHIPFNKRGPYKPEQLPVAYFKVFHCRIDDEGWVLCSSSVKNSGANCRSRAVNRAAFCQRHGGGLHPADKKLSKDSNVIPEDRVRSMDRPQQFMQGFLNIEDLEDEEVQGLFIYNNRGIKVPSSSLGYKFQEQFLKELHKRLTRFLQTKSMSMLNVMVNIAESDLVEPADRIKAAVWVAERTMGKQPEILHIGADQKPYEAVFEQIVGGSRNEHRQAIGQAIDAEVVSDDEMNFVKDDKEDLDASVDVEAVSVDDSEVVSVDDSESEVDVIQVVDDILQRKNDAKALKKRIGEQKRRRYAARAVGATSLQAAPWLIDWRVHEDGLLACLVPPASLSSTRLAIIASNDDATNDIKFINMQRINQLSELAEKFQRKANQLMEKRDG